MADDTRLMKKVLELARKGEGRVSPNPMVGAVIVKNGKIISEGFHRYAGAPHAEIEAITETKEPIRGSTLYVNLEPCCHWGKTPPCVDRIIAERFKRVVIATPDPNPIVKGKSIKKLKKAGIEVKVGILKKEAIKLNEVFFKNMTKKLPFVVVKTAQSLDGKIATQKGESKWITSLKSRKYAKRLRDRYDAVLVGINTVIKDNPTLNGLRKTPYKIIIDTHLKIPLHCHLIQGYSDKLIIFSLKPDKKKFNILKKKGVKIFTFYNKKTMPLKKILGVLYKMGITSLFVEGGSFTIGSFFDAKLVDKIYFFISPKIIGGNSLSSVGGKGIRTLSKTTFIKYLKIKKIGEDFLFEGYPVFH